MKIKIILLSFLILTGCAQKSPPATAENSSHILSTSSKNVKIKVTGEDLLVDEKKLKVMDDYKVLARLKKEMEAQLRSVPGTKAEIEITSFRLRSGSAGFFWSGRDMLHAEVTLKKKGKQVAYFFIEAKNSRGGKYHPPTRRLIALVHRFGEKVGRKMNIKFGTFNINVPGTINVPIPRPRAPRFRFY